MRGSLWARISLVPVEEVRQGEKPDNPLEFHIFFAPLNSSKLFSAHSRPSSKMSAYSADLSMANSVPENCDPLWVSVWFLAGSRGSGAWWSLSSNRGTRVAVGRFRGARRRGSWIQNSSFLTPRSRFDHSHLQGFFEASITFRQDEGWIQWDLASSNTNYSVSSSLSATSIPKPPTSSKSQPNASPFLPETNQTNSANI